MRRKYVGDNMPAQSDMAYTLTAQQMRSGLNNPRLVALLFADWAAQTTPHNKAVLCGTFDKIWVQQEGAIYSCYIYLKLSQAYEERVDIQVYQPNGRPLMRLRLELHDFHPGPPPNVTEMVSPLMLQFPVFGVYRFEVYYSDRSLGYATITVASMEELNVQANTVGS